MQKLGEGDTLTLTPWMWMESDRQGHRSTCLPLHKINQLLIIRLGSSSKQTMSINNPTTTISFPHTQTFLRKTSRHHGHRSFTGHRLSESSPSLGSTGGAQAARSRSLPPPSLPPSRSSTSTSAAADGGSRRRRSSSCAAPSRSWIFPCPRSSQAPSNRHCSLRQWLECCRLLRWPRSSWP